MSAFFNSSVILKTQFEEYTAEKVLKILTFTEHSFIIK